MSWLDGEIFAIDPRFQQQLPLTPPAGAQMMSLNPDDRPTLITEIPLSGTAIMRIRGTIMRGEYWWYSNTWQTIISDLKFLDERPSVKSVLLLLDSPGGVAMGCVEACDRIDKFSKPIVAYVEGHAFSAAYRLACHCDKIYATKSAQLGGIGTMMALLDSSKNYAEEGLERVVVSTGPYKALGVEGLAITQDQRLFLQDRVAKMQAGFIASLTARGLTEAEQAVVSDGRWWEADEAVSLRLIDGVKSFEDVTDEAVSWVETLRPATGSGTLPVNLPGGQKGKQMAHQQTNDQPATDAGIQGQQAASPVVTQAATAPAATAPAVTQSAPAGITISQIEQLCPGADPTFILQQAKVAGNTEVGVLRAYTAHQQAQLAALQAEKAVDKVTQTSPVGSNTLSQAPAGGQAGAAAAAVGPIQQFEAIFDEHVKAGMPRQAAVSVAAAENPELHAQYLTALKQLTPEQANVRRARNASRVLSRDFASK